MSSGIEHLIYDMHIEALKDPRDKKWIQVQKIVKWEDKGAEMDIVVRHFHIRLAMIESLEQLKTSLPVHYVRGTGFLAGPPDFQHEMV